MGRPDRRLITTRAGYHHPDPVIDRMARHLRLASFPTAMTSDPEDQDIERAVALRDDLLGNNVRFIAPVPSDSRRAAALELADVFAQEPGGTDPDAVARESERAWSMAGRLAGVGHPDAAVRQATVAVIRDRQRNPDPFASFAGSDR